MTNRWWIVTGAGIAALSGGAMAQPVLQVDINALSATATAPFDENFTGELRVFNTLDDPDFDGDASILDVLIDGTAQETGGAADDQFSFELVADFTNGTLTGGNVSLMLDQDGSENAYTADLAPGGGILHMGSGIFLLGGDTVGGTFTDPNGSLLGVDVNPWGSNQPLPGAFTQIELTLSPDGTDVDTDVDLFIVPTPGSLALLAIGGLAAIPTRRR